MAKLGGLIGAVVGFLLPFVVSDHIGALSHETSTWSDYVGTVIGIAFAVGGWVLGSSIARRLTTGRTHSRPA